MQMAAFMNGTYQPSNITVGEVQQYTKQMGTYLLLLGQKYKDIQQVWNLCR